MARGCWYQGSVVLDGGWCWMAAAQLTGLHNVQTAAHTRLGTTPPPPAAARNWLPPSHVACRPGAGRGCKYIPAQINQVDVQIIFIVNRKQAISTSSPLSFLSQNFHFKSYLPEQNIYVSMTRRIFSYLLDTSPGCRWEIRTCCFSPETLQINR